MLRHIAFHEVCRGNTLMPCKKIMLLHEGLLFMLVEDLQKFKSF